MCEASQSHEKKHGSKKPRFGKCKKIAKFALFPSSSHAKSSRESSSVFDERPSPWWNDCWPSARDYKLNINKAATATQFQHYFRKENINSSRVRARSFKVALPGCEMCVYIEHIHWYVKSMSNIHCRLFFSLFFLYLFFHFSFTSNIRRVSTPKSHTNSSHSLTTSEKQQATHFSTDGTEPAV